jgi:hypothetical protein
MPETPKIDAEYRLVLSQSSYSIAFLVISLFEKSSCRIVVGKGFSAYRVAVAIMSLYQFGLFIPIPASCPPSIDSITD